MRLSIKKLKTMSMLVLVFVVATTSAAFAQQDVDSGHWAYAAIEDVTSKGIMAADAQNKFSPDETVTNLETLIVIYRTADAAGLLENVEIGTLTRAHEADLEAIGLPKMLAPYGGDVYPAVSYALEKGILTLDEVKPFIEGSELTKIKKVNASVFFGKALNAYLDETLSSIVVLNYKDEYMISLSARKYVQFLSEKGIISKSGDANGNFNPNSEVSRAVLAVMAEGLYEALDELEVVDRGLANTQGTGNTDSGSTSGSTSSDDTEAPAIQTEKVVSGTISAVNDDEKTITVRSASGNTSTYSVQGARISHDDDALGFDALNLGVGVELAIKNDLVATIEVDTVYDVVSGKIFLLTDYLGGTPSFRSLRVELEDGSFDFKRVYEDTLVTLDGVQVDSDDLKAGYQVFIRYDGYDAKRIVAYSDDYTFSAILSEGIDTSNPKRLEATLENGVMFESALDQSVSFINAGTTLEANDIVRVTLKYGVATKIEKIGTSRDVVGTIEGIYIQAAPALTIKHLDGTAETVEIGPNAKFMDESGDERLTIYDLRLNQEVTAHVGVGGIETLQLGRKVVVQISGLTARVTDVLGASNLLIVTTDSGDLYTIILDGLSASDYAQGDVLYIEGEALAAQIFEASKITIKGE